MPRERSQNNASQDLINKARHILEEFEWFADGTRLLMLIHRAKEGSHSPNNDKVEKHISTNAKEFEKIVLEMLIEKEKSGLPLRLYSSVASRDLSKAIRKFKYEQLDAEYYAQGDKERFYLDIFNRWFGCLAQPGSASHTFFIIDCDSNAEYEDALRAIGDNGLEQKVIKRYPTKNGWHIVMDPFDPKLMGPMAKNIHKDGLILLHY